MRELLLELQRRLAALAEAHPEVHDTDSREAILEAIEVGFLQAKPGYDIPQQYRMFSWQADRDVTYLMEWFIPAARQAAEDAGLNTFHQRLQAVQNLGEELAEVQMVLFDAFDPDDYTPSGQRRE
jgi:hypothetical protein